MYVDVELLDVVDEVVEVECVVGECGIVLV